MTVRTFDIASGWDFEVAATRRAFLELQDAECLISFGLPSLQEVVNASKLQLAYLGADRGH